MRDGHADGGRRREPDVMPGTIRPRCPRRATRLALRRRGRRRTGRRPSAARRSSGARLAHHELLDERLRRRRATSALADGDRRARRDRRKRESRRRRDRRAARRLRRRARGPPSTSEVGIAGPCAHERNAAASSCGEPDRAAATICLSSGTHEPQSGAATQPSCKQASTCAGSNPLAGDRRRDRCSETPWQLHTMRPRARNRSARGPTRHHQRRAHRAHVLAADQPVAQPGLAGEIARQAHRDKDGRRPRGRDGRCALRSS